MVSVISVANQKGGVGKSSLVMNLGASLSELEKKILLVDLDPQGNLSSVFVSDSSSLSLTAADLFYNEADILSVIRKTHLSNLEIIPSNSNLSDLDARLAGDDDAQYLLLEELEEVKDAYDFILIDCPPHLGKATRMALVASDFVIVPIECQEWAVNGLKEITTYIQKVKRRANPNLELLGIVINKYNPRRTVEKTYNRILRETFKEKIFKTEFRNNVQYTETATQRLPITLYLPKSEQAQAYRDLAKEVIENVKKRLLKKD